MKTKENTISNIVDYFIYKDIIKSPDVYKTGEAITTDWYNNINNKEKYKIWKKTIDEWWNKYGYKKYDEIYTDKMVDEYTSGDIQKWWKSNIKKEINNEWSMKLGNYLSLNNFTLDNTDENIKINNKRQKQNNKSKNKTNNKRLIKKKQIIEQLLKEVDMVHTAPVEVWNDSRTKGGYIKIIYDNTSGNTTEGIQEIINILQTEIFGWEYIMRHEEFYWKGGAWENKYEKE